MPRLCPSAGGVSGDGGGVTFVLKTRTGALGRFFSAALEINLTCCLLLFLICYSLSGVLCTMWT